MKNRMFQTGEPLVEKLSGQHLENTDLGGFYSTLFHQLAPNPRVEQRFYNQAYVRLCWSDDCLPQIDQRPQT